MKKPMKLMTALLTMALLLQIAPAGAVGYRDVASTYNRETADSGSLVTDTETEAPETDPAESEPETEITETDAEAHTTGADADETETAAPETETEAAEPEEIPAALYSVQWQGNIGSNQYFKLENNSFINKNIIRVRMILVGGAPDAVTVSIDGAPIKNMTVSEDLLYFDVELNNGTHEMTTVISDMGEETTYEHSFRVAGATTYPEVCLSVPETIGLGQTADIIVKGENISSVSGLSVVVELGKTLKVPDVVFARGVSGMYFWYRGELNLVLNIEDASLIEGNALATVKALLPATASPNFKLKADILESSLTIKEDSEIGKSENYVNKVTMENKTAAETATSYNISGIPSSSYENTVLFVITDQDAVPAPGVSLYNADNDELIGVGDEYGIIMTNYFPAGGTYRVYCSDDNGVTSDVYEFTY